MTKYCCFALTALNVGMSSLSEGKRCKKKKKEITNLDDYVFYAILKDVLS